MGRIRWELGCICGSAWSYVGVGGGGGLCMWCISACEQRGVWLAVECFCVSNCSERGGGSLFVCVRISECMPDVGLRGVWFGRVGSFSLGCVRALSLSWCVGHLALCFRVCWKGDGVAAEMWGCGCEGSVCAPWLRPLAVFLLQTHAPPPPPHTHNALPPYIPAPPPPVLPWSRASRHLYSA